MKLSSRFYLTGYVLMLISILLGFYWHLDFKAWVIAILLMVSGMLGEKGYETWKETINKERK